MVLESYLDVSRVCSGYVKTSSHFPWKQWKCFRTNLGYILKVFAAGNRSFSWNFFLKIFEKCQVLRPPKKKWVGSLIFVWFAFVVLKSYLDVSRGCSGYVKTSSHFPENNESVFKPIGDRFWKFSRQEIEVFHETFFENFGKFSSFSSSEEKMSRESHFCMVCFYGVRILSRRF